MLKAINRFLIFCDAIIIYFINKFRKKMCENKNVLIVFQQVFGDAVVLSDSLQTYCDLYSKEKGFNLKLIARPAIIDFMKQTLPIPKNLNMESVDFKKFTENYKYYKEIRKKYYDVDLLIVPGTSLSAEIFSTVSLAHRKVGLVRSIELKRPLPMVIFSKIAYTEIVKPEVDMMMLQRHRLLLNYLGAKDFTSKLPKMLQMEKLTYLKKKYCVICPGASVLEKCWPLARYVDLIDYIIENKGIDVHLCGGKEEKRFEDYILNNTKYPKNVISHIGKTSFEEWVSIIQYSEFVLGNDSATVHIAIASRIKTICISGVYDKFLFFPYKVDKLEEGDFLPITIMHDMECALCRTKGYYSGYKNKECKKQIKNGNCSICIDRISLDTVKKKVDEII